MTNILLIVAIVAIVVVIVLQFLVLRRKVSIDLSPVQQAFGSVEKSYERAERAVREEIAKNRDEASTTSRHSREELGNTLKGVGESLVKTLSDMGGSQRTQLGDVVEQLSKLTEASEKKLDAQRAVIDERLRLIQAESATNAKQMREETAASLKAFNDSVLKGMTGMAEAQQKQMEGFSTQLGKLVESNEQKLDSVKAAVEEKLKGIQEDNAKQLDQMRATVDEKLQGTLEKRLGESFTVVSEQLKHVHEGLGSMQALATDVGDLRRVMSNVKNRGTWGEVLLDNLLAQVLSPVQYDKNVRTKEESGENVEFAIKLPGRVEDGQDVVWLPIDSKFPKEAFEALGHAQDRADLVGVEAAGMELEAAVKNCAKDICSKYLNPPKTTDFGIMFLPSEGLYAEVIRRIALVEVVQRECRVLIVGPSNLAALLNSLQMGFKTLQIQKTSSEVWKVLGAVKTEFGKFGLLLDGVKKKLDQASDNIDQAARKSRTIERKLRKVEELPSDQSQAVLMLEAGNGDGEIEEA